ncbi:hypothetical protein D3C71_1541130 [compost metagenome]
MLRDRECAPTEKRIQRDPQCLQRLPNELYVRNLVIFTPGNGHEDDRVLIDDLRAQHDAVESEIVWISNILLRAQTGHPIHVKARAQIPNPATKADRIDQIEHCVAEYPELGIAGCRRARHESTA